MYKTTLLTFILFTITTGSVFSQNDPNDFHPIRYAPASGDSSANSTGFSGTSANIDVVYHRAALTINPNDASKNISWGY